MIKAIEDVSNTLEVFRKDLKEFLTNKDLNLDERWEAYCKACDCGIIHYYYSCYYSHKILDDKDFNHYDDLCMERYETISFVDFIERLSEDDQDYTKEEINIIKEDILQNESSSKGFEYDW